MEKCAFFPKQTFIIGPKFKY